MAEQKTAGSATEWLDRLTADSEKLEAAIEQTIQALRKRGLQLPIDLSGMARTVKQDADHIRQTGSNSGDKLHQFEELVRTTALITSSLDLNQVLEDVIDTIINLTQAERAYLMLRDKQSGELRIRTARNWDKETLDSDAAGFSRGVINAAMEHGQPILTTNAQADERFQAMKSVFSQSLRSIMVIPLILRDQTLGVLYADNRIGVGNFSQDAIPIITAFANQAAIAIENAKAFGKVKADLDEAKTEVERLRIQIDSSRLEKQIGEITETEYFQNLQTMANNIRRRGGRNPQTE
ncbi:MAG: GAF domain-containing protein [Aggregatilineales bacterium]